MSPGWPAATGSRPWGITWHWTATADLASCRRLLGGPNAERRGQASAHYAVGRSFAEGIDRYVSIEDRSWHAGKNQLLRWDGGPLRGPVDKGARTTLGIETVGRGYARRGLRSGPDWIRADTPDGRFKMRVEPWTEEQVEMMIVLGRRILRRWPEISPRDHHGHHDLCPTYKVDPCGFPFARVLRGIYEDPSIADVWTPLQTVRQRQRALILLGQNLGPAGADARWGRFSDQALHGLQNEQGMVGNGLWTSFVCWKVYDLLTDRGLAEEIF